MFPHVLWAPGITHVRKHTRPFTLFRATESGAWALERGYSHSGSELCVFINCDLVFMKLQLH